MGIDPDRVVACPITQMVKDCLADSGMDNKSVLKCRNMFALGLVCWLFNRDLNLVSNFLREKFAKKPAIAENNIKVVQAGFDYGHNVHASVPATYRIESTSKVKGRYMDITGNKATAYGLIAAAEKAGLRLYLGSYPITPATDILHELSKHKSCGVITVQCEDEISGCASAIGAAFAGALAATSTSGPGICLKSEAMNLAVIDELPLVVIDVQRGGPAADRLHRCGHSQPGDRLPDGGGFLVSGQGSAGCLPRVSRSRTRRVFDRRKSRGRHESVRFLQRDDAGHHVRILLRFFCWDTAHQYGVHAETWR